MSFNHSSTSLSLRYSSKNDKKSFGPATKAIVKDHIVSSKFGDLQHFVPSYVITEPKPEISSLMSMEYAKIWEKEHKVYQKNVIEKRLIKKPTLKRPTFQSPKYSVLQANALDNNKNRQQLVSSTVRNKKQAKAATSGVTKIIKHSEPKKAIQK